VADGGKTYYHNASMERTSWVRPTAGDAGVDRAITWKKKWSKTHMQAYWTSSKDGTHVWDDPTANGGALDRSSLLPEGWHECARADGRAYYHNTTTGEDRDETPTISE
jgi:hypothetical protein